MRHQNPNPLSSIKRLLLSPKVSRYPSDEYKAIFETLLFGSFILVAILTLLLFFSYLALGNTHVLGRIFVCGAALLYLSVTYGAWASQRFVAASRLLIVFYYSIAVIVMLGWGVDTTFSQLMLAITIVLGGILLGSRAALTTAAFSIAGMVIAQFAVDAGWAPWFNDAVAATHFGDVIGFSTLLSVLAVVSALFGKHTQELRAKDQRTNEQLTKEKGALEQRVQEHSRQLKNMQLEEIEQLYKFAEIGQLNAVLLHDIANHLTVLNVDLADLKRQRHTETVKRLEESIDYIEETINQARRHLQIKDERARFDVLTCVQDSLKLSHFQHSRPYITVHAPQKRILLQGDSLRLSHILVILVRNALEAYPEGTALQDRTVTITLQDTKDAITVRVSDKGHGVSPEARENLFMPLRSAKKGGLGLGLYIAKKIAETHFNGNLQLDQDAVPTEFILTIPKKP